MVGGIPTAYFISRCDKKWRGLLLAASIFPMMTNSVIRSFAWINILGSNGIINKFLLALGLADKPMKLLLSLIHIFIRGQILKIHHLSQTEHPFILRQAPHLRLADGRARGLDVYKRQG